ncbi:hypothetical protein [Croceitalea rosinachiae]|uniref:Disulfide bond formation protein B n=1 Tax=Croceitalea rosinachiae TaxID=3075596 RepID=A0ABU3ADH6_9FLAO|nr:hypothetical protein [Croceitalea sp. F388]MDT0608239.1 hypothetical protein [Croceitalea sp. F388]
MRKQKVHKINNPLKQVILTALLFMLFGTALELYLLNHFEDIEQLIPLICIAISIVFIFLLFFKKSDGLVHIFKLVLAITALSGIYGAFLHLRANYEFELEMRPTANGWSLFLESMSGALPALAPCSMIVLALIGYSYLILLKKQK